MGRVKDLTGQKFGRLTVIERAENKGRYTCWKCRCDCGNEVVVQGTSLKSGATRSCGCLRNEGNHYTHGMRHTRIYRIYYGMINRTTNPNATGYKNWGGRGITVCERWLKFKNFLEDVKDLPHCGEKGYSIDRINNEKGYEPDNVRFVTRTEQNRNRRNNILVEFQNRLVTLGELSEITGVAWTTLKDRYKRGDRGDYLVRPVSKKERGGGL